jgi:prephenate dehydratase
MSATERASIAFQGEPGAYSHQACVETYPDMEPLPCPSFEDAIAAVRNGEARLAMLPIENSVYGRVADIHHLLPGSGLYIIGEHFVPIRLQLLGLPGAKLKDIKVAHSHAVALGQCRIFLKEHGIKAATGGDTAGSARHVAEMGDRTHAAIASRLAGEINGLEILAQDIEDHAHNTTRFLVMSRQKIEADRLGGDAVTSFVFEVRNVPAALYKALGGFATNGVNMTKLESYMVNGSFTATQFYAEVEGHPDDRSVELALEELQFFSKRMKILGVYPASPYRKRAAGAAARSA